MGTRHLVAVQLDGEYKIAQYGQWDGYPEGQGKTVLDFLKSKLFKGKGRARFEEKLRAAAYMTDAERTALDKQIEKIENWQERWPELSRDAGAKILEMVATRDSGIKLNNSISFAGDSLFCEWAYVIDLDKSVLEVYVGFNKKKVDAKERFAATPVEGNQEYHPIRLLISYPLSKLPTLAKMCKDCKIGD